MRETTRIILLLLLILTLFLVVMAHIPTDRKKYRAYTSYKKIVTWQYDSVRNNYVLYTERHNTPVILPAYRVAVVHDSIRPPQVCLVEDLNKPDTLIIP